MKTTNIIVYVFFFILFLVSCEKNKMYVPPREMLIKTVVESDNVEECVDAYNSFLFHYYDEAVLPLSVHMIEKYGYGEACNHMYGKILRDFKNPSVSIDSATQKYMLYYLKKGIELKDTASVWIMCRLCMSGTFVEKDTIMAKKLLLDFFSAEKVESLFWPYLKRHTDTVNIPIL